MRLAVEQNRVIVTNDKDFGDHVFRNGEPHCGVVLLRLADERAANKIARLAFLLARFPHSIDERFIVVTDKGFRVASRYVWPVLTQTLASLAPSRRARRPNRPVGG